jgi:hypothetical protein
VYINKVGIELEGGWHKPFEDVSIGYDGSVLRPLNIGTNEHWGELVSNPLFPEEVEKWVKKYYPNGVGATCGLHIHTSFEDPSSYYRLCSRRFYNFFLKEWEKWGLRTIGPPNFGPNGEVTTKTPSFWIRLDGGKVPGAESAFAQREFRPQFQISANGKGDIRRRSHLNYCFALHGTLECRLLPMFSESSLAVEAIMFYLEMIEVYLEKAPREELKTITVMV